MARSTSWRVIVRLACFACAVWLPPVGASLCQADECAASPAPTRYERCKAWFRTNFVRPEDTQKYGLRLESGWERTDIKLPVVVLVHGFNSNCERSRELLPCLRCAGLPCGGFDYPNDERLADAAELLSKELKAFHSQHPDRHVALLTHSMGGLVARACIEDPRLDPSNVSKLVMISPPTHGTQLVRLAFGTDLWEYTVLCREGSPLARFRASIADGMGEALDDMKPGSSFLTELNRRSRNADVQYTLLLGSGGPVLPAEWNAMRSAVRKVGERLPFGRGKFEKLDRFMEDLDEVVAGRGDGVVALKRGRLDGVADTIVIPFEHLSVSGAGQGQAIARVHETILARLRAN